MLPLKKDEVLTVAELPTCQKTLQACAPLISWTLLPTSMIKVVGIWKMKTELGVVLTVEGDGPGEAQRRRSRAGVHTGRQRLSGEVGPGVGPSTPARRVVVGDGQV
ncbi:hypothetical protein GCM10020254_80430 [Streptomyces goshikiensis]